MTFIKRKNGLFKKAHELSILTGAKVTVHVEDIKERQFDYVSANLGGDAVPQNFPSDDDDDELNSRDGHEELHDADLLHESASSVGSSTAPGSKRDSGVLRPGHQRSLSSVHLSPNPNVSGSRRSSGHPYPRSPNAATTSTAGLARPASMDFGMSGYGHAMPAGGPQRKFSIPSMPLTPAYPQQAVQQMQFAPQQQQAQQPQQLQHYQQQQQQQQVQQAQIQSHQQQSTAPQPQQQSQQQPQQQPQQQQPAQFYFHPNQSQPAFGSYDQQQQQSNGQQQMPRYNGSLFQTTGHPATNSQRHMPAYPSNLVPSVARPHSGTLPSSKEVDSLYQDFGGNLPEFLDDDMDQDFDALATQASTPGNYDFSTNPSLTNLNMTAASAVPLPSRNAGTGYGPPQGTFANFVAPVPQYATNVQQGQGHQYQQQVGGGQRNGFYGNVSGAQSTPNLAWLSSQAQISPQRRT